MDADSTLITKTHLIDHMNHWLQHSGMRPDLADTVDKVLMTTLILIIAVGSELICRYPIMSALKRMSAKAHAKWTNLLYDPVLLKKLADLIPVILIYLLVPIAFTHEPKILHIVQKLCVIYMIVVSLMFTNLLLKVGYNIYIARESYHDRPLKGLLQIMQVALFFIGGIVIISVIAGKSPLKLFAGLGASAAIMMLIFKDSIMGFVSGIQLSANDMLRKGDWITLPNYGADGTVTEVTLTTVKIQNFDNTIVTVPPYVLTSEAFQNWRGMEKSDGRRIMRAVNIDIDSVRFCTPQMIERYKKIDLLRDFIAKKEAEQNNPTQKTGQKSSPQTTQEIVREFAQNVAQEIATAQEPTQKHAQEPDLTDFVNRQALTNLTVFRAYLTEYLRHSTLINKDLTYMVRHLQPTSEGIPIQLYCFVYNKEWVAYEGIQADIFDHVMSVVSVFDLVIYQTPSGEEILRLSPLREGSNTGRKEGSNTGSNPQTSA